MKLETKLDQLLPPGDGPFDVTAFELWREAEGGWSVNGGWKIARGVDRAGALQALRGRWEVFKVNYLPKARVCDLQDIGYEETRSCMEVDCTAFCDVELSR